VLQTLLRADAATLNWQLCVKHGDMRSGVPACKHKSSDAALERAFGCG
jgi:hypothetical protein